MPIHWNETQSLLQLIVSFNLAYFVFISVSTSVADKALRDLADARARLDELGSDINIINSAKLKNKWRGPLNLEALREYSDNLKIELEQASNKYWAERNNFDSRRYGFGLISAILGLAFTILLFYATVNSTQPVSTTTVWFLATIGIFPVFILLIFNIMAYYAYHELRKKFFAIEVRAGTVFLNIDTPGTDIMDTVSMQLFVHKQSIGK